MFYEDSYKTPNILLYNNKYKRISIDIIVNRISGSNKGSSPFGRAIFFSNEPVFVTLRHGRQNPTRNEQILIILFFNNEPVVIHYGLAGKTNPSYTTMVCTMANGAGKNELVFKILFLALNKVIKYLNSTFVILYVKW